MRVSMALSAPGPSYGPVAAAPLTRAPSSTTWVEVFLVAMDVSTSTQVVVATGQRHARRGITVARSLRSMP